MKKNKKKGFSMMEVLLAVFVLSVGILTALTLITSSLQNSISARNRVIASQLAQEGVELIINIRDTNVVNGLDIFTGINSGNYIVDYCNSTLATPSSYILKYNSSGFYEHTVGTATGFKRKINIVEGGSIPLKDRTRLITGYVWWGGEIDAPISCAVSNKCVSTQLMLTEN